jgi:hypothetical protein
MNLTGIVERGKKTRCQQKRVWVACFYELAAQGTRSAP